MSSKILRYPEPYPVIFTVDYDTYMSALRQGKGHSRMKLFVDEEGKKFFRLELRKVSFNRDKVIYKTCQWYWNMFKGAWGEASHILVVPDTYGEVKYSDSFTCNDRNSRYLDEETIERLISESKGELTRETRTDSKRNHPRNPLKRVKRRRRFNERVGTNLYRSTTTGRLFYMTHSVSKNGKRVKVSNRLRAKNIETAKKEIALKFNKNC